jgi:hypothetical protein
MLYPLRCLFLADFLFLHVVVGPGLATHYTRWVGSTGSGWLYQDQLLEG